MPAQLFGRRAGRPEQRWELQRRWPRPALAEGSLPFDVLRGPAELHSASKPFNYLSKLRQKDFVLFFTGLQSQGQRKNRKRFQLLPGGWEKRLHIFRWTRTTRITTDSKIWSPEHHCEELNSKCHCGNMQVQYVSGVGIKLANWNEWKCKRFKPQGSGQQTCALLPSSGWLWGSVGTTTRTWVQALGRAFLYSACSVTYACILWKTHV